jgi:hypothetical protein
MFNPCIAHWAFTRMWRESGTSMVSRLIDLSPPPGRGLPDIDPVVYGDGLIAWLRLCSDVNLLHAATFRSTLTSKFISRLAMLLGPRSWLGPKCDQRLLKFPPGNYHCRQSRERAKRRFDDRRPPQPFQKEVIRDGIDSETDYAAVCKLANLAPKITSIRSKADQGFRSTSIWAPVFRRPDRSFRKLDGGV